MATTTAPPPLPPSTAPGPRPGPLAPPPRDTLGEWRSGWRVALRLARRDVRRHLGRSLLIVIMVAVPVLLLVGANVGLSTHDLSPRERLPYAMGQTQAVIRGVEPVVVRPAVDDQGASFASATGEGPEATKEVAATPIPGWGQDPATRTAALATLTGSTVIRMTESTRYTTVGRKQIDVRIRGVDGATYARQVDGVARLTSGRWPVTPTEALVSPVGIYKGLPSTGTVTVNLPDGTGTSYTIVGTGEGWITDYTADAADLITLPDKDDPPFGQTAYLVDRAAPVTWADLKAWADHGMRVGSRHVILNPPTAQELGLPPDVVLRQYEDAAGQAITSAIMAIGLLLETTLLVGPAFAVSAARQRRTLALAASNGATTPQLRRAVLAQALVLGVLAALGGAITGVVGAAAVVAWSRTYRPTTFFGPFDLPAWPLAIVVGCAIASAVIAAMIPSRGLDRLDIVGVMRGQNVSPRAKVRTPIAGIILAALGTVGVFAAIAYRPTEPTWLDQVVPFAAMLGAILLVVGALLLVPMILVSAARLARPAPVSIRMALRDAARQRGRATSTVAAILGGTALLSAILVVAASDSAFRGQYYKPQLPYGQARIVPQGTMDSGRTDARWGQTVSDLVRTADPTLQVRLLQVVDVSLPFIKPNNSGSVTQPFLVALREGCTPGRALQLSGPKGETDGPPDFSCTSLRGMGIGDARSTILVADLPILVSQFGLDAAAEATLRSGGIVVSADKAKAPVWTQYPGGGWGSSEPIYGQVDIVNGAVTFAKGTVVYGPDAPAEPTDAARFTVKAYPVPAKQLNHGSFGMAGPSFGMFEMVGALVTTETAKSLQWPSTITEATIVDPRGPISEEAEAAITGAAAENNLGWVYVERGFQPYDKTLARIVLSVIGLIILVATLVSTALSTAETLPMMGTFAAVGATRMTRRNLAAAQAGTLGVIGAFIGIAVGFVPGIALARASTSYPYYVEEGESAKAIDPTVVIPWLQLAVPVFVVPLIAAALAWLAIRRAPTVTRRLT